MSAWALGCRESDVIPWKNDVARPAGIGAGVGGYILPCQACVTSHPTSLGFLGCLRTQAKAAGLGAAREAEAHSPDPWTLLILVLVFICFSFPK